MADFYEVLGVSRDATQDEVKRAYRRLARQHHPDANPDDAAAEERFKEISRAYEVLSDPEKRRRYDTFGDERAAAGFGDFADFGGFANISDLFSTFFGATTGARTRRGPAHGRDVLAEVSISLEDAYSGCERTVEVTTMTSCENCGGLGSAPGTTPVPCDECGGSGEVRTVRRTLLGNVMTASICPRCGGVGERIIDPCPRCRGRGRVSVTDKLTVAIPAGVDDGARLRVSGRGEAGMRGGRAGNLYVGIHVEQHSLFRRVGEDLGCEVGIPVTVAALGGSVEIPTMTEPELVEVKPGTQTGEVVRLKGKGMPRLDGRGNGELVALLKIETPTGLDAEQAELLKQFAEARGEKVGNKGFFEKIKEAFQ